MYIIKTKRNMKPEIILEISKLTNITYNKVDEILFFYELDDFKHKVNTDPINKLVDYVLLNK